MDIDKEIRNKCFAYYPQSISIILFILIFVFFTISRAVALENSFSFYIYEFSPGQKPFLDDLPELKSLDQIKLWYTERGKLTEIDKGAIRSGTSYSTEREIAVRPQPPSSVNFPHKDPWRAGLYLEIKALQNIVSGSFRYNKEIEGNNVEEKGVIYTIPRFETFALPSFSRNIPLDGSPMVFSDGRPNKQYILILVPKSIL